MLYSEASLPAGTTLLKPSSRIDLPSEITDDPIDNFLSALRHTACCSISISSSSEEEEEAPVDSSVQTLVGDVWYRFLDMLKAMFNVSL